MNKFAQSVIPTPPAIPTPRLKIVLSTDNGDHTRLCYQLEENYANLLG